MLEALNGDSVTWTLTEPELEQLRMDIRGGELGRAHIGRVEPVTKVGLVALAA